MILRKALASDKDYVLDFCEHTFSWGDYVSQVWDFWMQEGDLLVAEKGGNPIGICHLTYVEDGLSWIEGIRVHPNYRRLGVGSQLLKYSESLSLQNNVSSIYMLIEINNIPSLRLAEKENYKILETWNFYTPQSRETRKINSLQHITHDFFSNISIRPLFYVDSWRWIPLSDTLFNKLIDNKNVFYSRNEKDSSIGFLIASKHFLGTKILTIYGNGTSLENLLCFIEHMCSEEKITRLQILTPNVLPSTFGLEQKMKFHLIWKPLI